MSIDHALIFAAGLGKRMRPLTESMPKPLLPVCGKPMIQYHIEKLVAAGIRELVINAHWQAEKLIAELDDGHQFGAHIHWSYEPEILDTGGGIKNALPLLGAQPFIVVSGDVWTEFDFARLPSIQVPEDGAHIILVPNPEQHSQGDFALGSDGIVVDSEDFPKYTYSGIGIYTPGFIRSFGQPQNVFPLREALQAAIACGKVSAQLYEGAWEDVGTPERLASLEERLLVKSR